MGKQPSFRGTTGVVRGSKTEINPILERWISPQCGKQESKVSKSMKLMVEYECVDGMHFFTSGDALTKGLCVATTDLKVAFEEVKYQLEYLMKHNHGEEGRATAPMALEQFQEWLTELSQSSTGPIKTIPHGSIDWGTLQAAA